MKKYPLIQLGINGKITATMITLNSNNVLEEVTKESNDNIIQLGVYKRVKVTWSQTDIIVEYDGSN